MLKRDLVRIRHMLDAAHEILSFSINKDRVDNEHKTMGNSERA